MLTLEVKNIRKDFTSGTRTTNAVRDVSFTVKEGEMVAIVGKSGAGKSTVLNICAGLMKPSGGSVKYDGSELYKLSRDKLAEFRRVNIGYVFQHFNLLPMLTARENIAIPSLLENKKPDDGHLSTLAESLGITSRLDHFPGELSGGEQQRVAIARALINNPRIIFADEPTGNLDSENSALIVEAFRQMNSKGVTVVMVTHDSSIADSCHRILKINDGVCG